MSVTYDLGPLAGGQFHQFANAAGQVYHCDPVAQTTSYAIPEGFEDGPDDTWILNDTKDWPQWSNSRTWRVVLEDPYPSPPETYLDLPTTKALLNSAPRRRMSPERVQKWLTGNVLRFIFPEKEGYNDELGADPEMLEPHYRIYRFLHGIDGTIRQQDILLAHYEKDGEIWFAAEDHLLQYLARNRNESKNCYGIVQIGMMVQFYKYENRHLTKVGACMHLLDDARDVAAQGKYIIAHPLPFASIL